MPKTASNHRKWLMQTIAMYGGPTECDDDYVLDDDMLIHVSTQAAFDLHAVVIIPDCNIINIKKYLEVMGRSCSES